MRLSVRGLISSKLCGSSANHLHAPAKIRGSICLDPSPRSIEAHENSHETSVLESDWTAAIMLVLRGVDSSLEGFSGSDLCAVPQAGHPDGLPPNFENPPSLQPTVIAIVAMIMPFTVAVTTGRLFANRSLKLADCESGT